MIETFDVPRRLKSEWLRLGAFTLFGVFIVFSLLWWQTRPPHSFPVNESVVIQRGMTASDIAHSLDENSVVRSSTLLYITLQLWHDPSTIQAGTFLFDKPLNVFEVASRITESGTTSNLATVTLPEGFTIKEFAGIASESLPDFNAEEFLSENSSLEGYLFPDTYYVPADFTATEFSSLLRQTFAEKTETLQASLKTHPLGLDGVINMASLLEREANTEESMKMVSGILQNRLTEGMRLQTDASLEYVLNRPLGTLTADDLEIDSPYNTYRYDGLPPTPIGNPGLTSIMAVLEPTPSDYFYYLTDEDGEFHYAKTFDEHRANIERYLR
ncbi:endolytic transglycosylase MltG [Candidatus Nomurabacteria bacterium]|nr:endolytic transglycosylase MltG [Candidatus Nomurabacteria bacterium]